MRQFQRNGQSGAVSSVQAPNLPEKRAAKWPKEQRDTAANDQPKPRMMASKALAWLRQVHREAFEIAKRAMGQSTLVGSTQDHPGSMVCLERFLPTGCAKAPAIAGLKARKAKLGQRRRKIVAARFGEFEKSRGHQRADRVATNVLTTSVAAAVPIETRHRFDRTDFKRLAKHVSGRTPWFSTSPVVPQHRNPSAFPW